MLRNISLLQQNTIKNELFVEIWDMTKVFFSVFKNKMFWDKISSVYFSLFNDFVSISDCTSSNVRIVVKISWKGCRRKRSWPNCISYFYIILEEMSKNTKSLSQCSQCLGRFSKRGITEYKPSIIAWANMLRVTQYFLVEPATLIFMRAHSLWMQPSLSVMLVPAYQTTWRMLQ